MCNYTIIKDISDRNGAVINTEEESGGNTPLVHFTDTTKEDPSRGLPYEILSADLKGHVFLSF